MTNPVLAGKNVLITGASGGLGERFAHVCAAHGASVVLGARRADRLAQVVDAIQRDGGTAMAVSLDVTDEASIIAGFDAAQSRFGTIHGVIANAGIEVSGLAVDIKADDFDRVFAVNVRGAFLTAREGARRMLRAGNAADGRIVLISSITAKMTTPAILPYSASKAAVSHMCRSLAREWARTGPNVNALSPGYTSSEMVQDWFETEGGQKQLKSFPRRRLVEPDGLDGSLVYLLSDASKNTTGADITVDDGQSL